MKDGEVEVGEYHPQRCERPHEECSRFPSSAILSSPSIQEERVVEESLAVGPRPVVDGFIPVEQTHRSNAAVSQQQVAQEFHDADDQEDQEGERRPEEAERYSLLELAGAARVLAEAEVDPVGKPSSRFLGEELLVDHDVECFSFQVVAIPPRARAVTRIIQEVCHQAWFEVARILARHTVEVEVLLQEAWSNIPNQHRSHSIPSRAFEGQKGHELVNLTDDKLLLEPGVVCSLRRNDDDQIGVCSPSLSHLLDCRIGNLPTDPHDRGEPVVSAVMRRHQRHPGGALRRCLGRRCHGGLLVVSGIKPDGLGCVYVNCRA